MLRQSKLVNDKTLDLVKDVFDNIK